MPEIIVLVALTFLVALIYSSVGHGGASGYLAVLSFFAVAHDQMAASALCLNVLVAGLSFYNYRKAGHFSWKLTLPFVAASIPFAFAGGLFKIPPHVYALLLALALIFAGLRLLMNIEKNDDAKIHSPSILISLLLGGSIGLLSGMVGVGGGIFLSPVLILFHWARPKETAAASAFFILVNSVSGLAGRLMRGNFNLAPEWTFMIFAAFLGGLAGSRLGARHFSSLWLRRVLGVVLFSAAFKLLRMI